MKRVALLKSRLNYQGGLEKYTLSLAERFAQEGCEVVILTTDASSSPYAVTLGKSSKFSLYHHWHFDLLCQKWLKHHPQDIVFGMERNRFQTHYRAGSGVHAAYLQHRLQQLPLYKRLSLKVNPLHHFLCTQEKKTFEDPSLQALFTNSHSIKAQIISHYNTAEQKIHVVHNGVDWHAFETPFQQRKRAAPFTFLFVGNGYERKGLRYLLSALPLLQRPCQLLVIGKEKHPTSFQKQAPPNVHFLGVQPSLIPFYQRAHALVIPSLYDPCANVTLEALAMGLFVISSSYNGAHEILTPQTGIVIEDLFSKESVAAALDKAMTYPIDPLFIRGSVKGLDFSSQLTKIVHQTLYD